MTVIVSDTFTVSSDTNLDSHVPDIGSQWELLAIDGDGGNPLVCIASTDLLKSSLGGGSSRAFYASKPNPTGVDYDIQITAKSAGPSSNDDPFFFVARLTDTTNFYSAGSYQAANAADKKIFKEVAGVRTELATGDSGLTTNDVLKFEIRNATKKLFKNGVEQLSSADNVLSAAGAAGFGQGNTWANYADDIGTAWTFDTYSVNEIVAPKSLPLRPSMLPFLVR